MNNRNNHFIISAMTFIVMLFCQGLVSVNYAQTALFTESFENGGSIPPGWAVETVTAGNNVSFIASSSWPAGYLAYNGTYFVRFNSFEAGSGVMRLKKTTPVSTVGYTNVLVDFAWLESSGYAGSSDRVEVQWSTNGTTWSTAGTFERYNAIQGWKIKSQVLPVAAEGQPSVYIAFLFTSAYGNDCYLDLAHIKAVGPAPPSTITVGSGTVSCIYPYLTYWMAGRTQLLYTAAQLSSSGAPPGTITSIGFNVYSASASVMNQFNIRIGNTTDATITGWVTSGMQTCYSGTYSVPGTGWQMITLQTPFVYTGNNLIVEVCFTNLVFSAYSYVYGTTAPAGQIYPYWMDNITGCAYTGDPYTGYTGLPNLRFVEVPYTGHLAGTVTSCYNGTPLSGATVTCGTVSGTTSVTGNYGLYNIPVGTYTANYTMSGYLPASAPGTVISNNITTTKDVCLNPIPGYLSGVVTSAVTGNPVIGAKIMVGTSYAYSTGPNGAYTVSVYPVGTFGATFSKAGFDNNSTGPYTFTQNNTITQNCALLENLNAPVNVTAALNGGQTAINLSWGTPNGNYELLYDDGIQEGFQIWSVAGSYNAVKFTANGFPCTLNGGKINIGSQSSYPAGSNPLVTFQFLVFDATGTGGTPGTQIAGPFDFTPTSYGWNNFTFSSPVTISGSSFFIVQRQGGNNPNAAGIGIDATSNQLRSYLRFMPSGGWVNATGNFMMRALVYGPGGPSPLMLLSNDGNPVQDGTDRELIGVPGSQNRTESIKPYGGNESHDNQDNAAVVTGYQAWRLLQGQEGTPASWVSVGTPTEPSVIDNSWGTLPCNPYRWAVKTQYTGNRWSGAAFSNAVGKCWTAAVTVNANLSCPGASPAYATVRLQNTVYVDTIYLATLGSSGTCTFPQVWKGTYSLTVSRFGYSNYVNPAITIMGNTTINLNLLQIKTPPSNVQIDNQRLLATWIPPKLAVSIFAEDWSSGSFVTNGWATSGGTNWQISSGAGNPAPSATFSYNPVVTDYNQFLTSPNMTGLHSPVMTLKYDIYLSNYSTPNTNNLSVELWNGSAWIVLRTYSNSGDIAWTSETLDISAYTHNVIRIRFHAYGSDSYTINNWNIDNIAVVASDVGPDPCLQGYSFYLNGGLTAITGDTNYTIPGGLAPYGQSLACCVNALYGSGASTQVCNTVVSHFLCPPTNLVTASAGTTATISWVKPLCPAPTLKKPVNNSIQPDSSISNGHNPGTEAGLMGYNVYRSSGGDGGPWVLIRHSMNPDLLTISDIGLASGEYWYRVSAYYNLASYGFPGTYDESLTAGPEPVYILTTPTNRIVRNQTLPNAQSHCFDATQFIFVAGNNTSFTIQNGGSATMIAGQSIFYRPTTTVQSGGYLHGYIAPVGPFCPAPAIPAVITSQDEAEMIKGQSTFRIYPNPTTGNFILEKAYDAEMVTVDIFGMWGEKVMTAIIDGERKHEFSLSDKPVGVYFIRVIFGDKAETVKIVKQ